ncbi:hypothetical protein J6TS7_36140 [Paenibacillus dendritiformis]|uniref:hypothetical protein n=1 Tax=Paenibacillus melissococcoides TaxID=2912268 RepID=UPI001B0C3D1B|nr:hypothetical protein [Paenibacillus melissococcoides]GIO80004.1 hypothetical protein J6TS7_36140 [Paenibacillus dendritiformis]CAH8715309.1 hypothetical protein HTL2_004232 [Paenibacillus melissococcoides]
MEVLIFISVYGMPILGFLFIVSLLSAIKKIVRNQPYSTEMFWSGLLFAIIAWSIAIAALAG